MKKKLSFLLIFVMIFSMAMTGCNKTTEVEEEIIEIIMSEEAGSGEAPTASNGTTSTPTNNTSSTQTNNTSVSSTTNTETNTPSQKPSGPNVPVLNCGTPTAENALTWAKQYGAEMTWGKEYSVDSDLMTANIRTISLSGTYALKHEYGGSGIGIRGTYAYVDFAKNEIGFKNPKSPSLTLKSKKCSFQFEARHEYYIEHVLLDGHILHLTITDKANNQTDTIMYHDDRADYFSYGIGKRTDEYSESHVELLSHNVYSLQPYNPQVLILGDSFVDGFYETRYATHIKNKLNGSVFISGQSGGTSADIKSALNNLSQICQPKYVILAIGTNDSSVSSWNANIASILNTFKNSFNGATPILATVTLREDNKNLAFATQVNEWIRNSGYKYVDINKLTTVGGDMQTQDLRKFQSDKVHLSPDANHEVYNAFLSSVPELFN